MSELIIGFSQPTKFHLFAFLINKICQIPYDHVYIKWNSVSLDRTLIYQASGLKINFEGLQQFTKHAIPIEEYKLQITDETKKAVIQYAIDNCGAPYGFKQIIGIALVKLARLFGQKISNPFADGKKSQVCAELVGRILEEVLGDKLEIDLDTADPRDINEAVRAIPGVERVM